MLTVYRASAGAGKTYRLTGDYLVLLFSHDTAYRHILAVTFTNKATEEMKGRIIEALYKMATGKSNEYIPEIRSQYELTEQQVRKKAHDTLIRILHDYSAFHISTIDRFFQQTMRAFTREIGLQGGYGIEMDRDLVLTETIDRLLANLEKPESRELLGWLLRFAEDKIEGGGEWNLRREIRILAGELFKESYKASDQETTQGMTDKKALETYRGDLFALIRSTETEAKKLGEIGLSLMNRHGLQASDYNKGSQTLQSYFDKLVRGEMKPPTNTFAALADNIDGYFKKTTPTDVRERISRVYDEGMNDCVCSILALFNNLTPYYTAKEISRYYYTLGILTDISHQIAAYREEKNIMLIADTTELLHKVIDGSEAPFIYEKTGTTVDHYMIDEFQDTSGMQWSNFLPLLKESMAHDRSNLIVGDVKQSIYRFRNSDWELLDQQVEQDFPSEQVRKETLKANWRSHREVVAFNNTLFTITPAILQSLYNEALDISSLNATEREEFASKIISAYAKTCQEIAPPFRQKDGHVRIEFLARETEESEKDWKEEALDRLPGVIEQLQDNGYQLKDIAILTRTNQEGALVADKLLTWKEAHPSKRYAYDIISDDALFVNSSPAVRFLIVLLRYLSRPDDPTKEAIARFSYFVYIRKTTLMEPAFPDALKEELMALSRLSLYEITEGIYRLFSGEFAENEQAFIQAFLDMVTEFTQKESADVNLFLSWWDETGHRKTIATPDNQNAIRILTVHKSKGLGFKAVIVPFGDWEIDHKPTKPVILWCHPTEAPFNRLHLVPVRYGQVLGQTIFANDYFKEKLHACIDNLNTLYVAFTRAKEELIVFSPRPKKLNEHNGTIEKIVSIGDLLWAGLSTDAEMEESGEELAPLNERFDWETGIYDSGNWWKVPQSEKIPGGMAEEVVKNLDSIAPGDRLRLRLHAREYLFADEQRKHGALMHEILSKIRIADDIPAAVESYRQAGMINWNEAEQLTVRLTELLRSPSVASWYDGNGRILNEVDILFDKGSSRRPDRVMIRDRKAIVIDYKFGAKEDKRYQAQVRNYLKLIREMGYKEVNGYLWYVELDKIEEVFL